MNWVCPDDVILTTVKDVVEISVKCKYNVFSLFSLRDFYNNSNNNNNDNNNDDEICLIFAVMNTA